MSRRSQDLYMPTRLILEGIALVIQADLESQLELASG